MYTIFVSDIVKYFCSSFSFFSVFVLVFALNYMTKLSCQFEHYIPCYKLKSIEMYVFTTIRYIHFCSILRYIIVFGRQKTYNFNMMNYRRSKILIHLNLFNWNLMDITQFMMMKNPDVTSKTFIRN